MLSAYMESGRTLCAVKTANTYAHTHRKRALRKRGEHQFIIIIVKRSWKRGAYIFTQKSHAMYACGLILMFVCSTMLKVRWFLGTDLLACDATSTTIYSSASQSHMLLAICTCFLYTRVYYVCRVLKHAFTINQADLNSSVIFHCSSA